MLGFSRVAGFSSYCFVITNYLASNTDNTISAQKNGLTTVDVLTADVDELLFVSVDLFLSLSFEAYVVAGVRSLLLENLLLLEF
jgi:hypothetical protein